MTIPEYHPVTGALYETCERAIVRGQRLRISWHAPRGEDRVEAVLPLDLRTWKRAEFMLLEDRLGRRRYVRLDRIISAAVLSMHRPGALAS